MTRRAEACADWKTLCLKRPDKKRDYDFLSARPLLAHRKASLKRPDKKRDYGPFQRNGWYGQSGHRLKRPDKKRDYDAVDWMDTWVRVRVKVEET